MPVNGVTGSVRTLRTAKFKMGYRKRGKTAPSDTDVIVGKVADGVTAEMVAAYGAKPIPDADEQGVYSFGREVRGMLPFEWDATHEGHEVTLEILNRAWGKSRIRCSGTGGDSDHLGEAFVRDEAYRKVLDQAGLVYGERRGGWVAECRGRDCPLWHEREGALPACHRETRLHFILLHPQRDPEHPDYMQQLGWVEVATGSWNGTVDIQSGFAAIRALGGRSALIPFRLRRVMRSVSAPNGRVNKATLIVDHYADEVLIYASGPPGRAILRPSLRRQLAELVQIEAGTLALPPVTFSSVEDIQPQRQALPTPKPAAPPTGPPWTAPADRDEALDGEGPVDREEDGTAGSTVAKLNQPQRDELKRLCGGVEDSNGRFSNLDRFWRLAADSYAALGVPRNPAAVQATDEDMEFIPLAEIPENFRRSLDYLTSAHADWIRAHLESETGARDPDEPPGQGDLLSERAS